MDKQTSHALLLASREYAHEHRWKSWWHLWSTLVLLLILGSLATFDALGDYAQVGAGVLAGLVLVRMFILYHDHQHDTILKGSKVATVIMTLYGILTLNPPSIWRRSHNHHHKNNAKIYGAEIGSFPVMTTNAWRSATTMQRRLYLIARHPLTILGGYLTVFFYGMCVRSLIVNPREHFDSAIALVVHIILLTLLAVFSPDDLIFLVLIPCGIAAASGAYLFYAQHNYPDVVLRDRAEWDYVGAALDSSSYLDLSPMMHWFTGNIGYHHVHHLNHHIPFYRLPEAMAGLPELQSPGTTSLSIKDIRACLRLKLWDLESGRMIPLPAPSTQAQPAMDDSSPSEADGVRAG